MYNFEKRDTLRLMTNSRSKRGREEEEKRQGQGRGETREKEGPRAERASERQQRGRQVLEGHQVGARSHAAPATEPPQEAGIDIVPGGVDFARSSSTSTINLVLDLPSVCIQL